MLNWHPRLAALLVVAALIIAALVGGWLPEPLNFGW